MRKRSLSTATSLIAFFVFSTLSVPVEPASSGNVGICDPYANFGCSKWNEDEEEPRLHCIDDNAGKMPWATRPVFSSDYSVTADGKTYTPGEYTTIVVRVHKYTMKYRGLLITAVDAKNVSVGTWHIANDQDIMFWVPPNCANALLHNSAMMKPFSVKFRFLAPQAGTGKLTFRTLIKKGPANEGEFYHAPEVELREKAATPTEWILADVDQSCDTACGAKGASCSPSKMARLNSGAQLEAQVGGKHLCKMPVLADHSSVSPFMTTDGTCWYHSKTAAVDCSAVGSSTVRRFCHCTTDSSADRRLLGTDLLRNLMLDDDWEPLEAQPPTAARHLLQESAAPRLAGPLWLLLAIASALHFRDGRVSLLLVGGLLLLSLAGGADAHNWMKSPSRAWNQASTTAPCRGRKDSDTHAQVGPEQDFVMKWATGHGKAVYLVAVHEDDYAMLRSKEWQSQVDEYLDNAPAGSNLALTPAEQRYHGTTHSNKYGIKISGGMFEAEVLNTSAHFLTHPRAPTQRQFQYTTEWLDGTSSPRADKKMMYRSSKFPWIAAAARYEILYHYPSDHDAVRFKLPSHAKRGHYIVMWKWRGYYDCTDVDLFDKPVAERYGKISGKFTYNRIDHCQYVEPKNVKGQCHSMATSASKCINPFLDKYAPTLRMGINVVPYSNPAPVAFPDTINIPWSDWRCVGTEETMLKGTDSVKPIWWSKFMEETTQTDGMGCKKTMWEAQTTLSDAVLRCTPSNCVGIAMVASAADFNSAKRGGEFAFSGCLDVSGDDWEAKEGSHGLAKKRKVPESAIIEQVSPSQAAFVSFQPKAVEIAQEHGMLVDTGDTFGSRNGAKYGWKCAVPDGKASYRSKRQGGGLRSVMSSNSHSGWMGWNGEGKPSKDNTFAAWINGQCADGTRRKWEIALPNGIYKVTTRHHWKASGSSQMMLSGCMVEHTVLVRKGGIPNKPTPVFTRRVEVTDGRLTLEGGPMEQGANGGKYRCQAVNWLKIEKIGASLPPVWFPAQNNPYFQKALDARTKVGIVRIRVPYESAKMWSCRGSFLWRGKTCINNLDSPQDDGTWKRQTSIEQYGGYYDGTNSGVIVAVSDSPCDSKTCPNTHVCEHKRQAPTGAREAQDIMGSPTTYETVIDCKGAEGKYVSVMLPGKRILDATIEVNAFRPELPEDSLVCYTVEARVQTQTTPEFVIAEDPEDPIFYSTCLVREPSVTFLPTGNAMRAKAPRWKFNGHCLDCDSFIASKAPYNADAVNVNHWKVSAACEDCSGRWNLISPVKGGTFSPTSVPSPTPTPAPSPRPSTYKERPQCWKWCHGRKQMKLTWDEKCQMKAKCDSCAECFQGPLSGTYPPTPSPTAEPTETPTPPTAAPTTQREAPKCQKWCTRNTKAKAMSWEEKCAMKAKCDKCDECKALQEIQASVEGMDPRMDGFVPEAPAWDTDHGAPEEHHDAGMPTVSGEMTLGTLLSANEKN